MALLEAVLITNGFVDGADKMVDALTRVFNALDDSYRSMQKFEITMSTFSGSLANSKSDLDILYQKANQLGVSFESAAGPFAKFASAATGFSKSQVFEIFDSFATSLSAVRANGNEVNGVFLALQQIVSKGKLSMEELRLQLAERIPGAMKLAAQAANMNMQDFEKAVKNGTINTSEWLINFASKLKETFGPAATLAAKSFDAEVMRLQNTMFKFNAELVDNSGASEVWSEILRDLRDAVYENDDVFGLLGTTLLDLSNIAKDLFGVTLTAANPVLVLVTGSISLIARMVAFATSTFYYFAAAVAGVAHAVTESAIAWGTLLGVIDEGSDTFFKMKTFADSSAISAVDFVVKAEEAFERMQKPFGLIERNITDINKGVEDTSTVIEKEVKQLEKLSNSIADNLRKELKEYDKVKKEEEATINEMYKEAGLGSDMYFKNEANKLVQKVAKWQAAGADIEQSNQFLYEKMGELTDRAYEEGDYLAGKALESYQNMSRTLVDQFNTAQSTINGWVGEMGANIKGLDGSKINIVAQLDGGSVIAGIDDIIMKFSQMKEYAAQAQARSVSYNAETDGSWSDFYNTQAKNSNVSADTSANLRASSSTSITNNFNQNVSRSDVANIVSMQTLQVSRQ